MPRLKSLLIKFRLPLMNGLTRPSKSFYKMKITVGARSSNLSKAQCEEVLSLLHHVHPDIEFVPTYLETTGDVDLITSLRSLGQTDFFTKEIDERQLKGGFRI